jgi:hypothetical protein
MIFRSLDSNGDWIYGGGLASYATLNDAIVLSITTTLKTFYTECFFNTEAGLPWFDLINFKNKDLVVLYIKSAISEISGVVAVNEIEYTYNLNREFTINYNIDTLYKKNLLGTVII